LCKEGEIVRPFALSVCLVSLFVIPKTASSQAAQAAQQAAQLSAQQVADSKSATAVFLANSTVKERYYLLQRLRQAAEKPDPRGIAGLSVPYRGLSNAYAPLVKAAAENDGTYQPFAAVFDILGSFGDAGSGSVPAAQSGIQTQLFGRIDWESEHYGYKNTADTSGIVGFKSKWDFSYGGTLGLYPSLVLENLSSTGTIANPKLRPMFQSAFQWKIGPHLNHPLFSHGEATTFIDFGQNFLIDQVTSFKQGDDTVTATPVTNSTGRAAAFVEGGIQARIYADPIWAAHDKKTTLTPLFLISEGVRKDERFSASGDLAGFDRPRLRNFFQFFITLTKISKYSDDIKSDPPASVRFGVDIDRPIIEDRIGTATRFFVSGNFDVMKIFRPSTTP
jgi:hypothetical protein